MNLQTIKNDKPYRAKDIDCPECEKSDVIYLSYGYTKNWYYFSRGCSVHGNSPKYMCESCKHEFGKVLASGESDE